MWWLVAFFYRLDGRLGQEIGLDDGLLPAFAFGDTAFYFVETAVGAWNATLDNVTSDFP